MDHYVVSYFSLIAICCAPANYECSIEIHFRIERPCQHWMYPGRVVNVILLYLFMGHFRMSRIESFYVLPRHKNLRKNDSCPENVDNIPSYLRCEILIPRTKEAEQLIGRTRSKYEILVQECLRISVNEVAENNLRCLTGWLNIETVIYSLGKVRVVAQ